jgi:hypothetical protein
VYLKSPNIFHRIERLKSDERSDPSICDFGEADSHAIFYVKSLAHTRPQDREDRDRPESSPSNMAGSRLYCFMRRRIRATAASGVSGVSVGISAALVPCRGLLDDIVVDI